MNNILLLRNCKEDCPNCLIYRYSAIKYLKSLFVFCFIYDIVLNTMQVIQNSISLVFF
ncbi:hypothetical protein J2Y60_001892 [Arcicella sp. BE140]|nr:hypothetical protein [Arcicella sp. BE51]MDR6811694.1 hypothetical protein [Arcicella sp. BE140]MDR6823219.1 hypothetical protein [Arcicella sp. BE139]